ncbi:MAG: AAA family ATPase [Deltaproteobacteria bacterium]|nr:AAA family ATPase [Deltaproteobacteria bacterium]
MKEDIHTMSAGEASSVPAVGRSASEDTSNICAFPMQPEREAQQARATAQRLNIPFVDPLSASIEPDALALLDPDVAERRQVVPIRLVNDVLLVAMASPDEQIAVKSLELLTGHKIRPAAAPRSSIAAALHAAYNKPARRVCPKDRTEVHTAEEPGKKRAFNISVISNKGGVGKTHFSINLAYALGKTGARVLLIDADLGSADISNKLGMFPETHLMDFLQKNRNMEDLVVATDFGFDLICGTYGEFKLANLYYAQKVKFINHFKRIAENYDYAVLDLGAGIARTVLDFALGTDRTVIVTTPQDLISGYACAKASFSRFKELEEKLEGRLSGYRARLIYSPMLVLNQVADMAQGEKLFHTISKTADENININEGRFTLRPEYLGAIPYDKESLRNTEAKKKPLLASFPYIKASQCIVHMSKKFCNPEDPYDPSVKFRHSFRRFMAILSQKR